jgi:hypothetical protein
MIEIYEYTKMANANLIQVNVTMTYSKNSNVILAAIKTRAPVKKKRKKRRRRKSCLTAKTSNSILIWGRPIWIVEALAPPVVGAKIV